ncbi:hypothetical protein [uncultured Pseudomonas sp.]|uniref:hypothetical protein n=1 Tax=uncultured Pseudomonas sp. TaxID=114707 RepID=UPI0030DA7F51|tara:strand:- start:4942 stop:5394 length:453 start_codon:yes stop_codon:yes gene_type:complete
MNNAKPWVFPAIPSNAHAASADIRNVKALTVTLIRLDDAGGAQGLYGSISWQQATYLSRYLVEHGPSVSTYEQAKTSLQRELDTRLSPAPQFAADITTADGIVFHGQDFLVQDYTPYGTWVETICGDLHQARLGMIHSGAQGTFAICLFY